ncbi:TPA: hypothetical protein EYG96_01670, partial [Candidatus Gracilibacteria bacterium]|nr:hypothetical protein [Candidatus Gracilibacteria bacterium]
RSAFWAKADGTGICPKGYRVPTRGEIIAENIANASDMFSELGIPMAGVRIGKDDFGSLDSYIYLWSSSPSSGSSRHLWANDSQARVNEASRALGMPVRCIED